MADSEVMLGLPGYEVLSIEQRDGEVWIRAAYVGPLGCPRCSSTALRNKGRFTRRVRHDSWGMRRCILEVEARKWLCQECGSIFRQPLPGILKW